MNNWGCQRALENAPALKHEQASACAQLIFSVFLLATVACSEGAGTGTRVMTTAAQPDAAAQLDSGGLTADGLPPFVSGPFFVCTPGQNAKPLGLATLPASPPEGSGFVVFNQLGARCNPKLVEIVLHNPTASPIDIEELGVDDVHFYVRGPAVRFTLLPGDLATLHIGFQSEVGEFTGSLNVATADGCTSFQIRGMTIDPTTSAITMTLPAALNFGHVAAGTTSEPIELSIIHLPQRGSSDLISVGSISSATPSFLVEPVTDSSALDQAACEVRKARVRLVAPSMKGVVKGQLTYESSGAQASAFSIISAIGIAD